MTIYREENVYAAMPSVATDAAGTLSLAFRIAPREPKGYTHLHSLSSIAYMRSDDDGATWSAPVTLGKEDELAKQDPNVFITPRGRLLVYYFRYCFHPRSERGALAKNVLTLDVKGKHAVATLHGVGVITSDDGGKTFSHPSIIRIPNVPSFAVRGTIAALPGGTLLMPVYAFVHEKGMRIALLASNDDGTTWHEHGTVTPTHDIRTGKKGYVEPSLFLARSGRLWVLLRTHEKGRVYTSVAHSDDGGETFSRVRKTSLTGHPTQALSLPDGRVFLVYGFRGDCDDAEYGVRYRIVRDDFRDVARAREHVLDATSKTPDCGYPSSVLLHDRRVLTVYYRTEGRGVRSVCGAYAGPFDDRVI